MEGANLINCHMVCANLEGSNLRGKSLYLHCYQPVYIYKSIFAHTQGTNMDSGSFNQITNLEGANLNVCSLIVSITLN